MGRFSFELILLLSGKREKMKLTDAEETKILRVFNTSATLLSMANFGINKQETRCLTPPPALLNTEFAVFNKYADHVKLYGGRI